MHRQTQLNLNFCPQEPFVFGDWKEMEFCSVTCGEGKVLVQRTCTPTHPDKSCACLPPSETLRPGNETCKRDPCEGEFFFLILFENKPLQELSANGRTGQTARPTATKIQIMHLGNAPRRTWPTQAMSEVRRSHAKAHVRQVERKLDGH